MHLIKAAITKIVPKRIISKLFRSRSKLVYLKKIVCHKNWCSNFPVKYKCHHVWCKLVALQYYIYFTITKDTNYGLKMGFSKRVNNNNTFTKRRHAFHRLESLIRVPEHITSIRIDPRRASSTPVTRGSEFAVVAVLAIDIIVIS